MSTEIAAADGMPDDGEARRLGHACRSRIRNNLVWYLFVGPPLILLTIFVAYPTFESFRQSFYRQAGSELRFAGLDQYRRLADSGIFWNALGNTALLGISFLALVVPLAVVIASMINRLRYGGAVLKVIYFLPQLTSSVAVAIVFNYVFQPDWGLLNGFLRKLGVDALPQWLADPRLGLTGSRAAVTILAVWAGLGWFVLIFLVGLQSIPIELYEAAAIDGANTFQTWRAITLPSLRPTFIFLLMTGTVDAMSRFGDLWALGGPGGAPARSLQSVVVYMFQVGFEAGDSNLAAAIAVVFFMLMLGVTLISFRALLVKEFRLRPRRRRRLAS
ncbi:sugar ABC transporter permease [Kribbella ginsengisoli]|uniref:carbohydrate ABC transporter permease n=1 Tax=Kribbella ginsengisoli TaxID=363865 RepID=UPI0031D6C816